MATARISEGLWTCAKRWRLEAAIVKGGHRWPPPAARMPMSGAECIGRILAWLDERGDPDGDFSETQDDDVEFAACWTGAQGALVSALIETGWIDREGLVTRWHDYGAYNSLTMMRRAAGSRGGKKSVETRRERFGTAQPSKQNTDTSTIASEANPKQTPEATSKGSPEQSGSGSGSGSEKEQKTPSESAAPKPRRKADPIASALAHQIGSGMKVCLDQVRALRSAGWDDERLKAAIRSHAMPGVSPWEWTRLAQGMTNGTAKKNSVDAMFDNLEEKIHEHGRSAGAGETPPRGLPLLPAR